MAAELTKRAGRMTRLRAAKLWAVGPETVDVVIKTAAEVVLGGGGAAKPISEGLWGANTKRRSWWRNERHISC